MSPSSPTTGTPIGHDSQATDAPVTSSVTLERTTHRHLLTALLTEARARFPEGATIRVLDAGCGNGHLIADLHRALAALDPARTYELYGFDVHDWEYLGDQTVPQGVSDLRAQLPEVPWEERIADIATTDCWPWPEDFFQIVVSNQVLEHVADHPFFFGEVRRVLAPGGFSLHLFPSQETVVEVHLHMPFVHWPRTEAGRARLIRLWARLGDRRFRRYRVERGEGLTRFTIENADFLCRFTNYKPAGEVVRMARATGLRADLRYTAGFYATSIRERLRRPPTFVYKRPPEVLEALQAALLARASCVTLFLENKDERPGRLNPIER